MSNLTPQIRNVIDAMGHVYTSYDFGHVLVPFQVSTMHLKHYLCFEICPFFFFCVRPANICMDSSKAGLFAYTAAGSYSHHFGG